MFIKKLKFLLLLCAFAKPLFALSNGGEFLVVPSPEVLSGGAFQVKGTMGYHQSACKEGLEMCDRHPFVTSARFGFFDFLDFGVQFGSNVSLDIRNQVVQAYGFRPNVAIGARAFVQSPEAYFYSVPKADRKAQTGEFYAALGWNSKWWNILGGVSVFPFMEADDVAPFWGFEQNFGKKFGIVYEGFFRYGYSHHNIGMSIKPVKSLQINAGATEFYRYFFVENGNFKYRNKNPGASSGYRSPGIFMSLAITGGFGGSQNQKEDMDSLKKEIDVQKANVTDLQTRLVDLEEFYYEKKKLEFAQAMQSEFEEIVKGYFETDLDLDTLRKKEEIFMLKGLEYKSFVLSEAQNKNAEANNRKTAIRILSHLPDSMFLEPLGNIATDKQNHESIAREAVLALGVINTPESRRTLVSIVNQTNGIVRQTIMDIIGEL